MRPFDENDLIAFHLQELSPRRMRALRQALEADPLLARESAEVAATLQAFHGHTALDLDRNLVERNWLALEPVIMKAPPTPAPRIRWNSPAVFAGGCALATLAAVVAINHHTLRTEQRTDGRSHSAAAALPISPKAPRPDESFSLPATTTPVERGEKDLIRRATRPSRQLFFASAEAPQQTPPQAAAQAAQVALTAPSAQPVPGAKPAQASTAGPIASPLQAAPATAPSVAPAPNLAAIAAVDAGNAKPRGTFAKRGSGTDLTLAIGGTFTPTRDGARVNNTQFAQGATHAVSAIASFHQQFRPSLGYRVAASYTRPDFHYLNSTYGQQEINGRVFELAGTYVIQGPHHGRISTAAEAGAGVMAFLATVDSSATSSNTRVAGVFGFSAEVALTKRLALQAAYRGQVYDGPDFRAVKAVYPLAVSNTLVTHEPSLGITYRFQHKQ